MSITQCTPTAARDAFGLAQIGMARHAMMGIRYAEGEGGAAATPDGTNPTGQAAGSVTPATVAAQQTAAQTTAAATAAGTQAGQGGQQLDTTGWPAEAVQAYEKARADAQRYQREAGDQRINAKAKAAEEARAEVLAEFAKTLGMAPADTPTVETVTAQLTEQTSKTEAAEQRSAAAERDLAAVIQAVQLGVDPAKLGYLRYSLSQHAGYGELDTTAPDFSDKVKASIATLIASDAMLRTAGGTGAGASGVESLGGANNSSTITPERFKAMSMAERTELYKTDKATYDQLVAAAR